MEKLQEAELKGDVSSVIALQQAIKFNGGGHINHSIFWKNLAPIGCGGGEMPEGELSNMIDAQYGSLSNMQATMSAASVGVQGSGWGWLGYDTKVTYLFVIFILFFVDSKFVMYQNNKLAIATCANQDPLEATTGLVPLLGIDVWEHAYYLQYKNVRPDYLKEIWKVVNWKDVAERLANAAPKV